MGEYKNVPQEINDVVSDNIKKLAQLFLSAVKDGQLDIDALKEELGTFEEVGNEKYEFTWSGKQNAKKIAQQDVFGKTLKFCPEKSKNADTTENIYIEGDNLEALKLLRQNYYNSIKMIYIDPPYNTGNDFVYNDEYSMSQEESDIAEGVVDELGERYTKNVSGNRFHANWCNMIYPRLKLAKDLLTDDGVIFISIDDNEVDNLKKICDEVFGSGNFRSIITVMANPGGRDYGGIAKTTEYMLVYSKSDETVINKVPDESHTFTMCDQYGPFELRELRNRNTVFNDKNRPNLCYPFYLDPNDKDEYGLLDIALEPDDRHTVKVMPLVSNGIQTVWRWGKEERSRKNLNINLKGKIKQDGNYMIVEKYRDENVMIKNTWLDKKFRTENGSVQVRNILGGKGIFSFPKPYEIPHLAAMTSTNENDIVLDFFSGSASTAHAVMQLNAEDGGNRKFILVQLPEVTDEKSEANKAGYNTICEIGEERIRRAGDKIKAEHPDADIDIGFKVFEIADTNIKWNELELKDEQIDFANLSNNPDQVDFKQGTKDIDVVYEIMLRQKNIPLSSKIEVLDEIGSRTYLYADSYLICLETQITNEMIDKLASIDPTPFKYIFRDSAFKDDIDLKTNAFRRLKAMVEKHAGATKKAYTVEFI